MVRQNGEDGMEVTHHGGPARRHEFTGHVDPRFWTWDAGVSEGVPGCDAMGDLSEQPEWEEGEDFVYQHQLAVRLQHEIMKGVEFVVLVHLFSS
mmetsp:Transcript_1991/g.2706  ORF Transcript_1991/g.2706 Transcript_1991/m.2706 type:complete len:94 (-) Transcript_1991:1462-1743(-)